MEIIHQDFSQKGRDQIKNLIKDTIGEILDSEKELKNSQESLEIQIRDTNRYLTNSYEIEPKKLDELIKSLQAIKERHRRNEQNFIILKTIRESVKEEPKKK